MNNASFSLLKTYLLLSLRRLYREKAYVGICVISLTIGMASFIVIGGYAYNELTFDHYHENRDDIYLIYQESVREEPYIKRVSGQVPFNFGRALEKDYPQIGKTVELISTQAAIGTEETKKAWNDVFYADLAVLDMFTHDVIYGDLDSAFNNPYSIAISESFAQFYFGDTNPLGSTLTHNDIPLTVTLVFADQPTNVFYHYNALIPMTYTKLEDPARRNDDVQMNMSLPTSLLHLDPRLDVANAEAMMNDFVLRQSGAEQKPVKDTTTFKLRNLSDLRLFSADIETGWAKSSSLRFFSLVAIGLCITFVASINTINLGAAKLFRQIEDINTQRLIGGRPGLISMQSLLESLCLSVGALLLALVLIEVCSKLSLSSQFADAFAALSWQRHPILYISLIGLSLVIGIASGLYPALKILRLPIQTKFTMAYTRQWISTLLIAIQLLVATAAITVTTFFVLQTVFIYNLDLGLELDNRLMIRFGSSASKQDIASVIQEIRRHPDVVSVLKNLWSPGARSITFNSFLPGEDRSRNDPNNRHSIIAADDYFAETMELRFLMGGPANHGINAEIENGVIISESILDILKWRALPEDEIIGSTIDLSYDKENPYKPIVLGVIKDFHSRTLRNPIMPTTIIPIEKLPLPDSFLNSFNPHIILNYSAEFEDSIVEELRLIAEKHIPEHLLTFEFLDELWQQSYGNEEEELNQAQFFSLIAILLCLLGLSGLSAYAAQTRRKELGIRKVIGASSTDLLYLMGKQFLFIACLISIPAWMVAYYIVQAWLAPFEYHIELSVWPFLVASLSVLALSQLTILSQSWKAARSNPVESLRYE